jgi:pseudoazurin
MNLTRRDTFAVIGGAAALASGVVPANAQDKPAPVTHDVLMLNKDTDNPREVMVFKPDLVIANPGDSIRFVPTDKGHFAVSEPDLIPPGAEPFKGKMSREETVTLTVEGAYVFLCTPHATMGMAMVVIVGNPAVNYESVKTNRYRGKALQTRMADIFARADTAIAAMPPSG